MINTQNIKKQDKKLQFVTLYCNEKRKAEKYLNRKIYSWSVFSRDIKTKTRDAFAEFQDKYTYLYILITPTLKNRSTKAI